jgi:hypothetical protein
MALNCYSPDLHLPLVVAGVSQHHPDYFLFRNLVTLFTSVIFLIGNLIPEVKTKAKKKVTKKAYETVCLIIPNCIIAETIISNKYFKNKGWAWGMPQVIECLPRKLKALSLNPSIAKNK